MALFKCGECQGVVSSLAPRCPHCGAPKPMRTIQAVQTTTVRRRPSHGKYVLYVLAGLCTFFYVFLREPIISGSSNKEPVLSKRQIVLRDVTVSSEEKVDKFGFMNISVTIGNPTDYKIKNIKIECTDKSNTFAELKKNNNIVYDYLDDHQKLRVKDLEMGMAHPQRSYTMCKMIGFDFRD
ncbi:hypothetical protein [Pseudomonas lundensis]|uniref:hypothetical protein n=1 Tax=Pseudomonas lundensis TaxID=86185 RepID=UPI001C306E21|nr:hypothetical protein [Pseudomonas lundensis]